MAEIELVDDNDGVVVVGDRSAIERFLNHAGLLARARDFDLGKLSNAINAGADALTTASGVVEPSAMYLKLTSESAKRLKHAGGLMKTKTKGVSHAMLGETGKTSRSSGSRSKMALRHCLRPRRCSPVWEGS